MSKTKFKTQYPKTQLFKIGGPMKTKILLFVFIAGCFLIGTAQTTIHVPDDYATIQEAINASEDGDTVLVDTGIYYENINYNDKYITIKSYFDPGDPDSTYLFNTIIDGGMPLDTNRASVVTFTSSSDINAVLQGFTIQHGNGSLFGNLRYGGGIMCHAGAKIIHNRIINNNVDHPHSAEGGGIYAKGSGSRPDFILKYNLIENNSVHNADSYPGGAYGGGVSIKTLNLIIENNIISNNIITGRPYGCGLHIWLCDGIIANNEINNNSGELLVSGNSRGGGIYIQDHDSGMEITNNVICNNMLLNGYTTGGGIGILTSGFCADNDILIDRNIIRYNYAKRGGGLYLETAYNARVSNNVIHANNAQINGGGVIFMDEYGDKAGAGNPVEAYQYGTEQNTLGAALPVLVNNTIIDNTAYSGGGIANYMADGAGFIAFNNIIHGNTAYNLGNEIFLAGNSPAHIYYNNIDPDHIEGSGEWWGDNNINADPCICNDSIHIESSSCCINQGTVELAINNTTYYCPGHDIDGEGRPKADQIDLGADECLVNSLIHEPDNSISNVFIYPNPCYNNANLQYQLKESAHLSIDMYDISGKKVQEVAMGICMSGVNHQKINMDGLPSGIYFIRITEGDRAIVTKIIKY